MEFVQIYLPMIVLNFYVFEFIFRCSKESCLRIFCMERECIRYRNARSTKLFTKSPSFFPPGSKEEEEMIYCENLINQISLFSQYNNCVFNTFDWTTATVQKLQTTAKLLNGPSNENIKKKQLTSIYHYLSKMGKDHYSKDNSNTNENLPYTDLVGNPFLHGGGKYSDVVLAENNGKLYFIPSDASQVVSFDPSTHEIQKIGRLQWICWREMKPLNKWQDYWGEEGSIWWSHEGFDGETGK